MLKLKLPLLITAITLTAMVFFAHPAHAAEVNTFVNVECANNGDGTASTCAGAPDGVGAYNSLFNWEAGEQTNLVSDGNSHTVTCIGTGTADTTAVSIAGWTTGASNTITIQNQDNHNGTFDTSIYHLSVDGNTLSITDEYVTIRGIPMESTNSGSRNVVFFGSGGSNGRLTQCIIRNNSGGANDVGVGTNASANLVQVDNNIFYDISGASSKAVYQTNATDGSVLHVYSNTLHNIEGTGIQSDNNSTIAINNIISDTGTNASGTFAAGTDYNATDDASIGYTVTGGGNTNDQLSATLTFVNEAGDDFHILAADTAAGNGTNTFASALYAMTEDIDQETRGVAGLDMGADELTAVASADNKVILKGATFKGVTFKP